MPGNKKKFIDKKNSVTFYLGHRSQKDPLITDEKASQRVLIPLDQAGGISSSTHTSLKNTSKTDRVKKKEEEQKYGIYFDDDYDYLQHLKDSKEVSNIEWDICERIYAPSVDTTNKITQNKNDKEFKLNLPSSLFGSEYEEEIGLLNKAAPSSGFRPDLDPDIIAALDDDFNFDDPENELEDNFMELAGAVGGNPELSLDDINEEDDDEMDEDSDDDTIGSMDDKMCRYYKERDENDDDNRSNFTSYSMSSSVVRRNKNLTLLDDRFERMFEEYEGTELGPLDCEEIEGDLDPQSEMLLKYADEYEKSRKEEEMVNEKIIKLAIMESDSDDEKNSDSDSSDEEGKKWDCESILSTYSNTKNRPKLIREQSKRNQIKVSEKSGMPVGELGSGLTQGNLKQLNSEYNETLGLNAPTRSVVSEVSSVWLPRKKIESLEERQERKRRIKEYKKERRLERKANTDAFRDEMKRQVKVRLNCRANLPGLKL